MPSALSSDLPLGLGISQNQKITTFQELRTSKVIVACTLRKGKIFRKKAKVLQKPYPFNGDWFVLLRINGRIRVCPLSKYLSNESQEMKNPQTKWFEKIS